MVNAVVEHKTAMVEVGITPMQLLQVAMDKGADIEKLQQLMDLQERWEANQARKAFDAAISAAKAEIKPIFKNREVDYVSEKGRTNYVYEDLAQIASDVDPVLSKFGLSYRYRSKQDGKRLTVTCVVSHRDGHSEETTLAADNDESGKKNALQAIGSAATYLQRYTLKLALGLSTSKDDDGRSAGMEMDRITDSQAADLGAMISEVGADKAAFLKYFKLQELDEMPASRFKDAVSALNKKRGAK